MLSDGYQDQFGGEHNRKFMSKKLFQILISTVDTPLKAQQNMLFDAFIDWKGTQKQTDDILILGIKL